MDRDPIFERLIAKAADRAIQYATERLASSYYFGLRRDERDTLRERGRLLVPEHAIRHSLPSDGYAGLDFPGNPIYRWRKTLDRKIEITMARDEG
jgi:hypothetical protein